MSAKPKQPKLERRKLKDLLPYPRQGDFFDDLPKEELKGLAQAMRKGHVPPIQILPKNRAGLPANTITDGHMRARAAELNGDTEVLVLVRYDLADASLDQIEREFLAPNINRRHLDKLAKARIALRMYELARADLARKRDDSDPEDARDAVGRAIGMSGRNLDRYFAVLRTPQAIQDAFRHGDLSLVEAAKIGCLSDETLEDIAARISKGESWQAVTAEHIEAHADAVQSRKGALKAVSEFIDRLVQFSRDLTGWITEEYEDWHDGRPNAMRRSQILIAALVEQLQQAKATAGKLHALRELRSDDLPDEEETDGVGT